MSCSVDAVRILIRVPMMFASPLLLSAKEIEAVQETISGVNKASISRFYHQEMSRISGLDGITGVEAVTGYARSFALSDGTSTSMWAVFDEIAAGKGNMAAKSVEAMAYQQYWQDLVSNTIGTFLRGTLKGQSRAEQNIVFEVLFFLYYFPLYVLMVLGLMILKVFPSNNEYLFKFVTLIETAFLTIFTLPFGLLGLLMLPIAMMTKISSSPLPSRQGYEEIPETDEEEAGTRQLPGTYLTFITKPKKDMKVGLRFGSNTSGAVVVTNIKQGSLAESSELLVGDLVFNINGTTLEGKSPRYAASLLLGSVGKIAIEGTHADASIVDDEGTV